MNYLLPFISVLLGYGISLFLEPKNKKNLKLLLAFSGAFLLALTVFHLLPEIYATSSPSIGLFIMLGILFQIVLEVASKGAEHGHVHGHDSITQIPWLLFLSLCIHALLEGFPVSQHPSLALGIAVHHLPIAIILATFFRKGNLQPSALFVFMLGFALMTPLGTFLGDSVPFITQYANEITAVVIGILFHISSTIIFESSEGHKFNVAKISVIVLGMALAYLL
ncbi:MAG: ZIP family metal transporter [Flavobacterium sp.]|nr:ZIP family metal transporter [Flavobacterium sp.]